MKVLMCPPLHYESAPGEDASAVMAEWRSLYRLLRDELGVQVDLLEPRPDMPRLVVAASGGFVRGDSFIVSRFRDVARQRESEAWANFFMVRGYTTLALPEGTCFEGERDLVAVAGMLFAGYRSRHDLAAHKTVSEILSCEVRSLRLSDGWDWPLDTCLSPMLGGTALYHPEAFHPDTLGTLEACVSSLRSMDAAEARQLRCNALLVDSTAILPEGSEASALSLKEENLQIQTTPMGAYTPHGVGPRALVLKIDD